MEPLEADFEAPKGRSTTVEEGVALGSNLQNSTFFHKKKSQKSNNFHQN